MYIRDFISVRTQKLCVPLECSRAPNDRATLGPFTRLEAISRKHAYKCVKICDTAAAAAAAAAVDCIEQRYYLALLFRLAARTREEHTHTHTHVHVWQI